MDSGSTPKATELEKQLAAQADAMYKTADNLSGGKDYLTNEATKVDRTGKYQEQNNAKIAAALSTLVKNPLSNSAVDNRGLAGGSVAAESDANSQKQTAVFSLANTGLGTQTIADNAIARQGQEDTLTQFMNQQVSDTKAQLIPSALGAATGALATSKDGQQYVKDKASAAWDWLTTSAPSETTVKKPFTGGFSGLVR